MKFVFDILLNVMVLNFNCLSQPVRTKRSFYEIGIVLSVVLSNRKCETMQLWNGGVEMTVLVVDGINVTIQHEKK